MAVRGRFAPTPSGRMHLGNVFCALIAWLSARKQYGKIVLRIEDLDLQRCSLEYAKQLEDDLHWLGLIWDEGGLSAAYRQSACTAYYAAAFRRLEGYGLTYPCFCTRAELHAANAPHLSDGQTIYSGVCRTLTAAQIKAKSAKRNPAIRLRTPDEVLTFTDAIHGTVSENLAQETGDFLLRRSDGVYAYQLAVVVDDARMGVTEVIRGNDLLASTARQLYLYHLLELTPPHFAHVPLLCAPDGRRLSKRDHDLDLGILRMKYRSPEPLIGRLAFLAGLLEYPEPISANDLIPYFALSKLSQNNILLDATVYQMF